MEVQQVHQRDGHSAAGWSLRPSVVDHHDPEEGIHVIQLKNPEGNVVVNSTVEAWQRDTPKQDRVQAMQAMIGLFIKCDISVYKSSKGEISLTARNIREAQHRAPPST